MGSFSLNGLEYTYLHNNPNPNAKYGLAITFWYTNMNELIFFLQLINKTWLNRDKIEIAICSFADLSPAQYEACEPLCEKIIKPSFNPGKESGTTSHMNGAVHSLLQNPNLKTITHVDSDEIIINHAYFFGYANMLLDSGKVMLNTQETYLYDMQTMTEYKVEYKEDWTKRLNHFMIVNTAKIGNYFPVRMAGNFHKDLWDHFVDSGFTHDDLFLLKRVVTTNDIQPNMLYGFNFHLGNVHECNTCEWPENEDRKIRLLRLMSVPIWDDIILGFKWHVNRESPVPNYKISKQPPYDGYDTNMYDIRR